MKAKLYLMLILGLSFSFGLSAPLVAQNNESAPASESVPPATPANESTSAAQPEAKSVAKGNAKQLQKVEVVASPLKQSTEDAVSLSDIRRAGAMDPAEAISKMTGVEMVRRSSISHDIVLRGQKKDAVNVTIDGHQMWGACPMRMDPTPFHADFAQVKEVTLVRGPYNVHTPGSEAGAVDIKTNTPKVKPNVKALVTYGSYNYANLAFEASGGFKYLQVLGGYSYRESQIYRDGKGYPPTAYLKSDFYKEEFKDPKIKAFGIHTAWGKLQVVPADGHRILFSGSYQNANGYHGVLYYDRMMDAIKDEASSFATRYEADKMGKLVNTYIDIYWNKVTHLMDTSLRMGPEATAKGFSQTVGAKGGTTVQLGEGSLDLGIDSYRRQWDMFHTQMLQYIPNVYTLDTGVFLEYRHSFDKTGLTVGGRGDVGFLFAQKLNERVEQHLAYRSRYFYLFGGNLQVNHYVIPELNLFIGLGHGNRLPDASETYNVYGNPALKAEHKTELDTGMQWQNKWVNTRLNLFYAFVDNFIALSKPKNLNTQAHMGGFEFDLNLYLPLDFSLMGQLAYTTGKKKLVGTLKDTNIGDLAPLTGMAGVRYDWLKHGLYIQTDVKFSAAQSNLDADLNELAAFSTKAWSTWNFRMGYEHKYFAVRLNIDNILNQFYYTHLGYMRSLVNPVITRVAEPGINFKIQIEGKYI